MTHTNQHTPKINRIAIIFNASKDKSKLEQYIKLIEQRAPNIEIDVVPTTGYSHGFEQAKHTHSKGYDLIVAAGGDGTLLSVVNAVVGSETLLTPLPLGTANDYSNALGINNVEDAARLLWQGRVRQADAGYCTYQSFDGKPEQTYFCSTAGVGLFAETAKVEINRVGIWLKKWLKDGSAPFIAAAAILNTNLTTTTVHINEEQIDTKMFLLELSNVPSVAGFLMTPYAEIGSETFDCWLLHNVKKRDVWRIFFKIIANKAAHLHEPNIEYFTSEPKWNRYGYTKPTRIEVLPEQLMPIHLNGESVGQTPVLFEIVPNSLKVLAP